VRRDDATEQRLGREIVVADLLPGIVDAVDRDPAERAIRRALRELRGERARVALLGLEERARDLTPGRAADRGQPVLDQQQWERVHPDLAAGDRRAAGAVRAAGRRDRLLVGPRDEVVEHRGDVTAVQRATARLRAPCREAVERVLVGGRRVGEQRVDRERVVRDRVERHDVDALRIQLGVGRAEMSAVGESEEVQL
jgi:hypothetical protein